MKQSGDASEVQSSKQGEVIKYPRIFMSRLQMSNAFIGILFLALAFFHIAFYSFKNYSASVVGGDYQTSLDLANGYPKPTFYLKIEAKGISKDMYDQYLLFLSDITPDAKEYGSPVLKFIGSTEVRYLFGLEKKFILFIYLGYLMLGIAFIRKNVT